MAGRLAHGGDEWPFLLRLDSKIGVKCQCAAIINLEHIQLHVESSAGLRTCSFSLRRPPCKKQAYTK